MSSSNYVNFRTGDEVVYVPDHADGDVKHKDAEEGVVTSVSRNYVFVRTDWSEASEKSENKSKACLARNVIVTKSAPSIR